MWYMVTLYPGPDDDVIHAALGERFDDKLLAEAAVADAPEKMNTYHYVMGPPELWELKKQGVVFDDPVMFESPVEPDAPQKE